VYNLVYSRLYFVNRQKICWLNFFVSIRKCSLAGGWTWDCEKRLDKLLQRSCCRQGAKDWRFLGWWCHETYMEQSQMQDMRLEKETRQRCVGLKIKIVLRVCCTEVKHLKKLNKQIYNWTDAPCFANVCVSMVSVRNCFFVPCQLSLQCIIQKKCPSRSVPKVICIMSFCFFLRMRFLGQRGLEECNLLCGSNNLSPVCSNHYKWSGCFTVRSLICYFTKESGSIERSVFTHWPWSHKIFCQLPLLLSNRW